MILKNGKNKETINRAKIFIPSKVFGTDASVWGKNKKFKIINLIR